MPNSKTVHVGPGRQAPAASPSPTDTLHWPCSCTSAAHTLEAAECYPTTTIAEPCAITNPNPKQCPLSCQLGEVALEQWAPWGRPPFGALMQLCFCMARVLSVSSTNMLSNRAEKPVCPPGPCCTLEFAVPSRPDGQQPKLMYAVSPCRMDRLARSPGGCDWSQLVRLCSRCREVVPMHGAALCGGRAEAVSGRRAVVEE